MKTIEKLLQMIIYQIVFCSDKLYINETPNDMVVRLGKGDSLKMEGEINPSYNSTHVMKGRNSDACFQIIYVLVMIF